MSVLFRSGSFVHLVGVVAILALPARLSAQNPADSSSAAAVDCSDHRGWTAPQRPLYIYGNTYYVGTRCISAILITSKGGHVLIDAGPPDAAALVLANIQSLGFRLADVKLLLNSHVHFDHAGGLAAIQHATGASVAASPLSAPVLEAGASGPDDPQFGSLQSFPPVPHVRRVSDREVVRVGELALTAHFTAGHTPGGTTWTWVACQRGVCRSIVYADSQSPVSAEGFRFTQNTRYPNALQDFAHGLDVIEHLPCDILLTPHPEVADFWDRMAQGPQDRPGALVDAAACQRFAAAARDRIAQRVAKEHATTGGR
jgi:metallo-beta-lactamase class B